MLLHANPMARNCLVSYGAYYYLVYGAVVHIPFLFTIRWTKQEEISQGRKWKIYFIFEIRRKIGGKSRKKENEKIDKKFCSCTFVRYTLQFICQPFPSLSISSAPHPLPVQYTIFKIQCINNMLKAETSSFVRAYSFIRLLLHTLSMCLFSIRFSINRKRVSLRCWLDMYAFDVMYVCMCAWRKLLKINRYK